MKGLLRFINTKNLLRFILLKFLWGVVIIPLVIVVSLLITGLVIVGIDKLIEGNLDYLGVCLFVPLTITLLLLALTGLARVMRKFDERKAARQGLGGQPPREGAPGEVTQSYGREHLK
jgi:hypothetical protein